MAEGGESSFQMLTRLKSLLWLPKKREAHGGVYNSSVKDFPLPALNFESN